MNSEDSVELCTFFDALRASEACSHLEKAGIPFIVEDHSQPQQGVDRFQEGPAVWLAILIEKDDLQLSKNVLRKTMHLFPEREVTDGAAENAFKEDVLAQAILCDALEDAEKVRDVLHESGIWNTIRKVQDDDTQEFLGYSVDTQGKDIERATLAIDHWAEQNADQ